MILEEVVKKIEQYYPVNYAMDWDNVGLLVGDRSQKINKIFITLDATDEVIDEAVKWGADLLLMHHPLIFRPLKRINSDDFIGRRLLKLIKNDIACYAMHTNYDVMGMADLAAGYLDMKDAEVFEVTYKNEISGKTEGIGRCASLETPVTVKEYGEFVKKRFHIPNIKIFGEADRSVSRIAVFPGSGKSAVGEAVKQGVELLVTGDIDHHEGIDAVAQGLVVIDAGHYGVEHIYIEDMKQFCMKHFEGAEIRTAPIEQPFWIM